MIFPLLRAAVVLLLSAAMASAGDTFRVATYNVENYVDATTTTRRPKSDQAKAKVRESLLALKPDVLALEEMDGATSWNCAGWDEEDERA